MKPVLPKEPEVPPLEPDQVSRLTDIVFLPEVKPTPCDIVFVFSGTHPGHWEQAARAYHTGMGKTVIVTGGTSPTGVKHSSWADPAEPESVVIVRELTKRGVPPSDIVSESRSRNTLENVLFAQMAFDFSGVRSAAFVWKNHAAGRQFRTFAQHVSSAIRPVPFGFDAEYEGQRVGRDNWMASEIGRRRVFGEYLRIVHYGRQGQLLPLVSEIEELSSFVDLNLGHGDGTG